MTDPDANGPLSDHVRRRLDDLIAPRGPRRVAADSEPHSDGSWPPESERPEPERVKSGHQITERVEPERVEPERVERERPPGPDWLATLAARRRRDAEPSGEAAPVRRFERIHLIALAALAGVGLVVTGFAVLSARAVPMTPAGPDPAVIAAAPVGDATTAPTGAASPSGSEPPMITVHVTGAVQRPGLVELAGASRVNDAIEAAGGLTDDADPAELNLAQALADGQQVVVGTTDEPAGEIRGGGPDAGAAESGAAGGAGAGQSKVNINTATSEQLQTLPGVGPKTAEKIIAWRTENGRFGSPEELQEVSGIGPKTYAELGPLITV